MRAVLFQEQGYIKSARTIPTHNRRNTRDSAKKGLEAARALLMRSLVRSREIIKRWGEIEGERERNRIIRR